MRVIKSILFIAVLTTALSVSTGCSDNSTGTHNGSSDSVTINFVNYLPRNTCVYVDNQFSFLAYYSLSAHPFKVLKNAALKIRMYDTIGTDLYGRDVYDTFNILDWGDDTIRCSDYDTIAKSTMNWTIWHF